MAVVGLLTDIMQPGCRLHDLGVSTGQFGQTPGEADDGRYMFPAIVKRDIQGTITLYDFLFRCFTHRLAGCLMPIWFIWCFLFFCQ